jgi:NADH-quinone oxidoreductase subunit G
VLVGGRSTVEDAYAYSKFARIVLNTNDIDFRIRAHSDEETAFLASDVAGQPMTVSYADLEKAPAVLLAGFEPEEESPIVFLRLRKAARKGVQVLAVAPFQTRGLTKMSGKLIRTAPGGEAAALDGLTEETLLKQPGSIILVGERLATSPGALSAASRLATATGARLGWVPRRAGDRGALEAGALPNLLPGGRPVADAEAREQTTTAWNVSALPDTAGRDTAGILAAAAAGELGALLIGGVEIADLPDPDAALAAIDAAPFVVSLELRESAVTDLADVVFPVAPVVEKAGSFVNWEGRIRSFEPSLPSNATPDLRVLYTLADEIGIDLNLPNAAAAAEELTRLGWWGGTRPSAPTVAAGDAAQPGKGEAVLTGWRMLLDSGRLQDGEPYLAGTARVPVVRLSATTAGEIGAAEGDFVTVATNRGEITLPLEITDMDDRVVWLPLNSPGSAVYQQLGVTAGAVVSIGAG